MSSFLCNDTIMNIVNGTNKKIYVTWGFGWKGARTTQETKESFKTFNLDKYFIEIEKENESEIHFTFLSANDMW